MRRAPLQRALLQRPASHHPTGAAAERRRLLRPEAKRPEAARRQRRARAVGTLLPLLHPQTSPCEPSAPGNRREEEGTEGAHQPRKHTVIVQPGGSAQFDLTANERGDWAFHCHLFYHMHNGMFQVVTVRPLEGGEG